MRIGIIGTRGIPNNYGGFEQLAQHLSLGLVEKGHDVSVYNSNFHPYKNEQWKGINIIHCRDWENKFGTAGQFFYDRNCINDARKRNFDVLLHLGYTSDSIWHKRWPKNSVNIINMDGLEWKRTKYNWLVKRFLIKAELLATKYSDVLVADSPEIQKYLFEKYGTFSVYIPYGATVFENPDAESLNKFKLQPYSYFLIIARIEPENNLEMVINGCHLSKSEYTIVIVGNINNKYGRYLQKKYNKANTIFINGIYEPELLNNLRFFSSTYFHGHSVGGTNPSLLEAMACRCRVIAHKNRFNEYVLGDDADYFSSENEIANIIVSALQEEIIEKRKISNLKKIKSTYNWTKIIDSYEEVMLNSLR